MLRSLFVTTTSTARRVRQRPSSSISSVSLSSISLPTSSTSTSIASQRRLPLEFSSLSRSPSQSQLQSSASLFYHDYSNIDEIDNNNNNNNQILANQAATATATLISRTRPQHQHLRRRFSSYAGSNYNSPAFVSKHNHSINVTSEDILEYCAKHNGNTCIDGARITGTHVVLRECPFCTKPTRNDPTNLHKLHIQIGGGAFFCHRCGTGGSWYDLKAQFGGFHMNRGMSSNSNSNSSSNMNINHGNNVGGYRQQHHNKNNNYFQSSGGSLGSGSNHNDNDGGWNNNNDNHNGTNGNTEPCLPMPPSRLSALYSSRLLDEILNNSSSSENSVTRDTNVNININTHSSDNNKTNDDSNTNDSNDNRNDNKNKNDALRYLTEVRGLTRKTLRKYGVGRAAYRFPSEGGGYQEAECITFPWIMRESDVRMQEAMRGAVFELESSSSSTEQQSQTKAVPLTKKNDGDIDDTNKTKTIELKSESKVAEDTKTRTEDNTTSTGTSTNNDAPTGPFVTRRIKARALERKSWQRLDPPGGGWGLFGLHTVPSDCTTIIMTEGEYDAMAVYQATGLPAVSLPNGCRSLPVQVLPLLERFEKIVLWMDADEPGREGAEKFAKKLGIKRTFIAKCDWAKDANDALLLLAGEENYNNNAIDDVIRNCIETAALVPHDRIVTFGDLRDEVLKELLEPELYSGTPIPSLPKFTNLIKGFRRGEMTVLTGPTGCGKTTFLGQISLDLAEQGENVLWGSFEIKNTRLLHKLLKQFSRDSLPISTDENARECFEALADRFENLPLYFMKFHGGSDVDEVLDAMEYAVYVNDVEHIILDNMQFMITRHSQKSSWDKFEVQDIAIEKFRKFATEHNVHVTLVVHPRKEDESSKLSISSFFGSAKATQEADTVIIIQNDANRRKYLDVKKNRFDGTLGYSPIYFQNQSGRYVEDEGIAGNRPAQPQQRYQQKPKTKAQPAEPTDLDNHWSDILIPHPPTPSPPGRA